MAENLLLFISDANFGLDPLLLARASPEELFDNSMANEAIILINEFVGDPTFGIPQQYTSTMFDRYSPSYFTKFDAAVNALSEDGSADLVVPYNGPLPPVNGRAVPFPLTAADGEILTLTVPFAPSMLRGSNLSLSQGPVKQSLEYYKHQQPQNKLKGLLEQSPYLLSRLILARDKYLSRGGWQKDQDLIIYNSSMLARAPGSMFTYVLLKWFRKELEADIQKHINEQRTKIVEEETYTSSRKPYPFPSVETVNSFLDNNPTTTEILMLNMMISMAFSTLDSIRYRYTGNTVSRKLSNIIPKSMGKWFRGSRYKKAFKQAAQGTRYAEYDRDSFRRLRRDRAGRSSDSRKKGRAENIADNIDRMLLQLKEPNRAGREISSGFTVLHTAKELVKQARRLHFDSVKVNHLSAEITRIEADISSRSPDAYHRFLNRFSGYGGKKTKQRRNAQRRKTRRRQKLHARR